MTEEEGGGKFTYFLAGLGIGTVIGILFAPRKGEETREMLQARFDESREYLDSKSRDIREEAEDLLEKGRKTVAKQKENIQSAVNAGKQAYRETMGRGEAAGS